MKNDGLYGTLYGGNKPRKLEFILGDALSKGASTILTFGALGSNHGLATALYGRQLGLRVVLLLTYQAPVEGVSRQLHWMQQAGATLYYTRSLPLTAILTPYLLLRYRTGRPRRWPYLIWPGASSPLGCLGYVNAALELAHQVEAGELPEPASVVVPLASAGTAAGLLLGLRLAGLGAQLVAVAVTRAPTAGAVAVARLARASAALLRRRGVSSLPEVGPSDITVVHGWKGRGYGQPTVEGEQARAILAETEGIVLESTYTAKAVAAMLAMLRDGGPLQGPLLYWHTYNALPLPLAEPGPGNHLQLPRSLWRFLQER